MENWSRQRALRRDPLEDRRCVRARHEHYHRARVGRFAVRREDRCLGRFIISMSVDAFASYCWLAYRALYCSSLTCSIQSTFLPPATLVIAIWLMELVAVAPCQCFTPVGVQMTSPALI